jgi:hypothetical protein
MIHEIFIPYGAMLSAAFVAAAGLYVLSFAFSRIFRIGYRIGMAVSALGICIIAAGIFLIGFWAHRPHYETGPIIFLLAAIGAGIGFAGMGIFSWESKRIGREFEKKLQEMK